MDPKNRPLDKIHRDVLFSFKKGGNDAKKARWEIQGEGCDRGHSGTKNHERVDLKIRGTKDADSILGFKFTDKNNLE